MQSNIFDIQYRVYIAGVLVPSLRVGITTAFNAPPTATITLPPYAELFGIGRDDRIPVHVFVKESWVIDDKAVPEAGDEDFILLFEGEVTGFSYSSTGLGRELNINAQSLFAVLKDVNLRVMTSLEEMVGANIIKGENNQAQHDTSVGIVFPMSLFMKGLGSVSNSNLIRTPSEYLENAYTFLQSPRSMGENGEFNDSELAEFYGKYTKQIRLLDRFQRLPYFDEEDKVWSTGSDVAGTFPLIDGIQKQAAVQQLVQYTNAASGVSRGPTSGSVYDLVDYVVSQMEYEFAFICCPFYADDTLVSTCLKPILYEAVPPACNIVYRPLVQSVQTAETVYQVPTRVRMTDDKGPIPMMGDAQNNLLASWSTIDYYPSDDWMDSKPSPDDTRNWYASELLDTEDYTGTYMFETRIPTWLPYVTPEDMGVDTPWKLKQRVMEHSLIMKRYQPRRVQSELAFNPYITPGFPGVIYDSDDHSFTFVGQIMSVSHSLAKNHCSTSISMSFARMIEEAMDDPLENRMKKINDVTQSTEKMNEVYASVLGSSAVGFDEVQKEGADTGASFQTDPAEAYARARRGVVTFEQYCAFMGIEVLESEMDEDRNPVPTLLGGDFVADRKDKTPAAELVDDWIAKHGDEDGTVAYREGNLTGIRWKLKAMADREFKNKVYN